MRLLAGIGNAFSFADGVKTGMELQRSMQDRLEPHANPLHVHSALVQQLALARDMKAVVHVKDLAPGESTAPHYHAHGHEVLCVLRGHLTTVFGPGELRVTPPNQSRYVGENVLHHGFNAEPRSTVQVLSINLAPRGGSSRVEVPEAFA